MYHMNAPETHNPQTGAQCGGDAATAELTMMLGYAPNGTVFLEYDKSKTDKYGRRLAYVWYQLDGQVYLINEAMVRSGYAESKTYKPDVKYREQINAAAAFAKKYQLGLWPPCDGFTKPLPAAPTPVPAVTNAGGGQTSSGGNCDPSYPTLCIPIGAPDLDCKDISARRFPVLPPDPMRFDGDHDGMGCESG
jgi:micrococcal nuclease